MKGAGYFIGMILFFSSAALAQSQSCEELKRHRLSEIEILTLIKSVCAPDQIEEKDHDFGQGLSVTKQLIYEYTSNCYKAVNRALRDREGLKSIAITQFIEQLSIAFCDEETYVGRVYRGEKRIPDDILNNLSVAGAEIQFPAFTSSSIQSTTACGFAESAFLIIHSKNGKRVSDSFDSTEAEVTFLPNSRFRVLNYFSAQTKFYQWMGCLRNRPIPVIELKEI